MNNNNLPVIISVDEINGTNGLTISGIEPDDSLGGSVSNAGDINGDGIDDLIIGASGAGLARTDEDRPIIIDSSTAGESYVIFGDRDLADSLELSALDGSNGFILKGASIGSSGASVSNAGDLNGDGIDDLIIGAPYADPDEKLNAGESYVVFGDTDVGALGILELAELDGNNGFVVEGADGGELGSLGPTDVAEVAIFGGDRTGKAVSNAGDVNGDGFDDLIIGADAFTNSPQQFIGESYLIFGSTNVGDSGKIELAQLDSDRGLIITGPDLFDSFGTAVSNAGDVNGDGFDDLIIGASGTYINDNFGVGKNYILFGGNDIGASDSFDVSEINGTNGFTIDGIDSRGRAGGSVSNAGDINGDGFDDLIIGASGAGIIATNDYGNDFSDERGESYVIFGGNDIGTFGNFDLSSLDGTNGFILNGTNEFDRFGSSVSNAGDVNNDGFDDLVIGATGASLEQNVGESYILLGGTDIGASGSLPVDAIASLIVNNRDEDSSFVNAVSNAGDINGDGFDDVILGSYLAGTIADGYSDRRGESYIIFGSREFSSGIIEGTAANDTLNGTADGDSIFGLAGDDRLRGLAGDDSLEGNGGNDSISGNNGNDLLVGGDGNDILKGDLGNDRLDGGLGNDTLFGGAGADSFAIA